MELVSISTLELEHGGIMVKKCTHDFKEQMLEDVDEADRPKLLEKVLDMLQQAERGLPAKKEKYTRRDSNPQPSVPKTDALSS